MNVLITNQQEALLSGLTVEIIKTLRGEYEAEEIIGTFSNFFFGRMILDLTAIKDYQNLTNIQKLSIGLPVEKIILLLPANGNFSTNAYLSKLISMGFYNFTTNLEGIEYLINNPNLTTGFLVLKKTPLISILSGISFPLFLPFWSVTSVCTVDFEIPNFFAAPLTVSFESIIYCAKQIARSSIDIPRILKPPYE